MKLIFLSLSVLLSLSAAKKFEKSEGIFVLTNKNYDAAVKEFDYLLVYFYAPWCGHCKTLEPEYAAAAKELKKDGIFLAKVNFKFTVIYTF